MEKEYKITFTADYTKYKELADEGNKYWANIIKGNPEMLSMCEKYKGKTVKLLELPSLVEEVGSIVLSENEVEIYNDYRE